MLFEIWMFLVNAWWWYTIPMLISAGASAWYLTDAFRIKEPIYKGECLGILFWVVCPVINWLTIVAVLLLFLDELGIVETFLTWWRKPINKVKE